MASLLRGLEHRRHPKSGRYTNTLGWGAPDTSRRGAINISFVEDRRNPNCGRYRNTRVGVRGEARPEDWRVGGVSGMQVTFAPSWGPARFLREAGVHAAKVPASCTPNGFSVWNRAGGYLYQICFEGLADLSSEMTKLSYLFQCFWSSRGFRYFGGLVFQSLCAQERAQVVGHKLRCWGSLADE